MLSIVIPTYNEALNLRPLAENIDNVIRQHDIVYELLIVNDNSPDGTADVANELSRIFPIRLLRRKQGARDLSLAVLDGIEQAQFDNIVVMDADLSHPPGRIPEMLGHLAESERAFVLGTRYAEGGGFSEIREVAIRFTDRELGASKMNLREQLKYLHHLRRLYLYRFGGIAEFLHFGIVGASGFIIDVSIYYTLQLFGLSHQLARALSFWPAVSWNWIMNRTTTFAERNRRPRIRQWFEFVITSLIGFSINWGTYVLLTATIPFFDRYRFVAFIFGIGAASVFNFAVSSIYVYSERRADGQDHNSAAGFDRREKQQ